MKMVKFYRQDSWRPETASTDCCAIIRDWGKLMKEGEGVDFVDNPK